MLKLHRARRAESYYLAPGVIQGAGRRRRRWLTPARAVALALWVLWPVAVLSAVTAMALVVKLLLARGWA